MNYARSAMDRSHRAANVDRANVAKRVPANLITSGELRARLGLNHHQYNQLVNNGTLKRASRNRRGWSLYTEDELKRVHRILTERLRRSDIDSATFTAEEASSVFDLLEKGRSFSEIVRVTKLHPYTVQAIQRELVRGSGGLMLSRAHLERINRLPLEDVTLPILAGDDIVRALEAAYAEKKCSACRRRPRSTRCSVCAASRKQSDRSTRESEDDPEADSAA